MAPRVHSQKPSTRLGANQNQVRRIVAGIGEEYVSVEYRRAELVCWHAGWVGRVPLCVITLLVPASDGFTGFDIVFWSGAIDAPVDPRRVSPVLWSRKSLSFKTSIESEPICAIAAMGASRSVA